MNLEQARKLSKGDVVHYTNNPGHGPAHGSATVYTDAHKTAPVSTHMGVEFVWVTLQPGHGVRASSTLS